MNAWRWVLPIAVVSLIACSSVGRRKEERATAYQALGPSARQSVDRGQIEQGMGSNAVYIAWGPPSAVVESPSPRPQTIWVYYENRAVLRPGWTFLPDQYGYWTAQPTTEHYSGRGTKAEVVFENGRVVEFRKY